MGVLYQRRQFGIATVAIVGVVCLIMLAVAMITQAPPVMLGIIVALNAFAAVIFGSLTIRVSAERVDFWFTFGFVHSGVAVSDICEVRGRKIFPLGFGVRVGDNATAWLTSGRYAVDLTLRGGRHLLLGTAEPDKLAAAIEQARSTST